MSRSTRKLAAAIAAAVAVAVPLVAAAPASALTTGDQVVFLSNSSYTDVGEEDATMIAGLEASGATVTVWDGGDFGLAAFEAALTDDVDAFVIPESDGVDGMFSPDALAYLTEWVTDGGRLVLGYFIQYSGLISAVTGLDYSAQWNSYGADEWTSVSTDATLPAAVNYVSATTSIVYSDWDATLLAGFTPLYVANDPDQGDHAVVARWAVGSGAIYGFGWDWYPDEEVDPAFLAAWNAALTGVVDAAAAVEPEAPVVPEAPQLAATGTEAAPFAFAALALVLGGAALVLVRRRAVRADAN